MNQCNLSQVSFLSFFLWILCCYKFVLLFFMSFSIVIIFLSNGLIPVSLFHFWYILLAGFFLSIGIHEYAHLFFMKRFGIHTVTLHSGLLKFQIITTENLTGKKLFLTALSGPLFCSLIGMILFFLAPSTDQSWITIVGVIYLLHGINLLPIFGDGKMILKSVLVHK